MGLTICKMCFSPCTKRCELVPWMIEVDTSKRSCGDKTLLCRPSEDYEAIDVVGGYYVRGASAVEDTPRGTVLNMGRSCDTWVKPKERARLPMARSSSG